MVKVREQTLFYFENLCKGREIRLKLDNLNLRYNLRLGTLACFFTKTFVVSFNVYLVHWNALSLRKEVAYCGKAIQTAKSIKKEVYGLHNCQEVQSVMLSKESHISILKPQMKVNLRQKSSQTNQTFFELRFKKVVFLDAKQHLSKNTNGE